jgi:hypothetical protein
MTGLDTAHQSFARDTTLDLPGIGSLPPTLPPHHTDLPHYLRQTIATYVMLDTVMSLRLFKSAKGQEHGLEQLLAQHLRPVDIGPGVDSSLRWERATATSSSSGSDAIHFASPP